MSIAALAEYRHDDPVAVLLEPSRDIDVWPGHRHTLCRAEAAVIDSPPFQRLWRLRQMGLAFHAFPNAENSRASHSLGVAYWSTRFLAALKLAPEVRDGLSTDLVVRLFALIHDIDLLPLGHTLRYQSSLLGEAPGRPRLASCIAAIRAHVGRCGFTDTDGEERQALLTAFDRHLAAAAAARPASEVPAAALASEIVNSMLGADLFDFALRDSFAIGRKQMLHGDYPAALRLVTEHARTRLALDAAEWALADDLYRARFEIFAASINHPRKLAADAMLDAIVRRIEAAPADPRWSDDHLLTLGDDAFLDFVSELEAGVDGGVALAPALRAGQLHEEVYRTTDLDAFRARTDSREALALAPAWRDRAEAALRARLPGTGAGDLIVALSAERMQAKPPDVLLVDTAGRLGQLADIAEAQAGETAAAYRTLWSLRVYLSPDRRALRSDAARAAATLFAPGAAPW